MSSLGPHGWEGTAGQPGAPWLGGHSGAAWDPVAGGLQQGSLGPRGWGATAGRPGTPWLGGPQWGGLRFWWRLPGRVCVRGPSEATVISGTLKSLTGRQDGSKGNLIV